MCLMDAQADLCPVQTFIKDHHKHGTRQVGLFGGLRFAPLCATDAYSYPWLQVYILDQIYEQIQRRMRKITKRPGTEIFGKD